MAKPRQIVGNPSFTPLPFGLLSALGTDIRNPSDGHWQNGVIYQPLCAGGSTTYDECLVVTGSGSTPQPPPTKDATAALELRGAQPFTVYSRVDCSAPGFWDRANELVNQSLTQAEQWQVERAFWTGLAGTAEVVYPHLAADTEVVDTLGVGIAAKSVTLQTAATVVTGAALDVVEGLGRLESALSDCYDGVGVIHVPRVLAPALADASLLRQEGPRYRTPNGHIVVLGSGYPGTAPDGSMPSGSVYVYATGSLMIYRSAASIVPTHEAIDRANNSVETLAERQYLLAWDCCHIAVHITIGGEVAGTTNSSS